MGRFIALIGCKGGTDMPVVRPLYWLLAGTLVGVSLAALPSIGILLLPAGVALVLIGALWLRARSVWAFLVGFGTLPALLIVRTILTAPPVCPVGGIRVPFGVHSNCGGPLPQLWYGMAIGFALIALLGLTWPLAQKLRPRHPMT
jgi:hypothetical protein